MTDATTPPTDLAPAPDAGRASLLKKVAMPLLVVGAIMTAAAFMTDDAKTRLASGYLIGFGFVWAIVLGSLFFVALQHVTGSVWSVTMRRVAEMLASPMGLVALLFVPVAVFAVMGTTFHLFEWTDPSHVEGDPILEGKTPYLNIPFWLLRAAFFFLLWTIGAWYFVRQSLKQDTGEAGAGATVNMRKFAAPFMILFGLTLTFAAFDWMMSLEPHWFSTIYGVYVFSGVTLSGLAAITLLVLAFRKQGWIDQSLVGADHLYSLGGLLFAFTCFWAYISFSQFMLIWYANIPEETIWYVKRMQGGWGVITWLVAFVRFVLPFFLLLPRDAKSDPKRLKLAAWLILAGQLVDLYWLIAPAHLEAPKLPLAEFGPALLLSGVLVLALGRFLARHRVVAVGDPLLEKSRQFHL